MYIQATTLTMKRSQKRLQHVLIRKYEHVENVYDNEFKRQGINHKLVKEGTFASSLFGIVSKASMSGLASRRSCNRRL